MNSPQTYLNDKTVSVHATKEKKIKTIAGGIVIPFRFTMPPEKLRCGSVWTS
jgi:hypothetical protein